MEWRGAGGGICGERILGEEGDSNADPDQSRHLSGG